MSSLFIISCSLCYLFQIIFLILEKKQKMVQTLFLKWLASSVFVILGAFSFIYTQNKFFSVFIFVGLIFDAAADVVFNLRFAYKRIEKLSFLSGTFLFFTGHIFYLIALIPQVYAWWIYLSTGIVLACLIEIFFALALKDVSLLYKIYGVFYILMVSVMSAMALGNYKENAPSTGYLLFALGAVFFLISDVLLIFNTFRVKKIYPVRVISFVTYYTGQLLIAGSLYLI